MTAARINNVSDAYSVNISAQDAANMKFEYGGQLWRIVGTFDRPSFIVESDDGDKMHIGVNSFIAKSMKRMEQPTGGDE